LDGGFGVGKTHLLASLWHAVEGPKAFGTFVELTNLVGALGFEVTVAQLGQMRFLAIDEFELDDPGDTVLMSTLLSRLVEQGVFIAATSNTLPESLGEGRFAAADFLREIQGLAAHFDVVRVDGEDYRHRGHPVAPQPLASEEVVRQVTLSEAGTVDDFERLLYHLGKIHPSKYGALLDGVTDVGLLDVYSLPDQTVALRMVVLADRLYDRGVRLVTSGIPLDQLFTKEMMAGGYRKKYRRALSRLIALARPES
jgi:cell division protein ZapE